MQYIVMISLWGLFVMLLLIFNLRILRKLIEKNIIELNHSLRNLVMSELQNLGSNNTQQLNLLQNSVAQGMRSFILQQNNTLDRMCQQLAEGYKIVDTQIEKVRTSMETHISRMQCENSEKLEKIRMTVEEKLHDSLEKRLGESFKNVSERLEMVHRGLGEMQHLANGVGDLKKVLNNVKTRGIWGEIQLGNILKQVLAKEQYMENVQIDPMTQDRVEYAIKLPGNAKHQAQVWLPIDAKCPLDDYHKLLSVQESGDAAAIDIQTRNFEKNITKAAKVISTKYIIPPLTTDFAIMFLPIEGMYAEVLQKPGLVEVLQRDFRVVVTGPTTISALLNSLQMGFRTLAIERRSSDIWKLLDTIRNEFTKFADMLCKTKIKLEQAGKAIQDAEVKTRSINEKLEYIGKDDDASSVSIAQDDNSVNNDLRGIEGIANGNVEEVSCSARVSKIKH